MHFTPFPDSVLCSFTVEDTRLIQLQGPMPVLLPEGFVSTFKVR